MHHGNLPLGPVAVLLQPGWAPAIVLFALSILLFPDGHAAVRAVADAARRARRVRARSGSPAPTRSQRTSIVAHEFGRLDREPACRGTTRPGTGRGGRSRRTSSSGRSCVCRRRLARQPDSRPTGGRPACGARSSSGFCSEPGPRWSAAVLVGDESGCSGVSASSSDGRHARLARPSDRDRDRHHPLPALRDRPADLADALVCAADRAARRRLRGARPADDARAAVLLARSASPRRRSRRWRSSTRCAAASSASSTAASTARTTTPRRRSPRSRRACADAVDVDTVLDELAAQQPHIPRAGARDRVDEDMTPARRPRSRRSGGVADRRRASRCRLSRTSSPSAGSGSCC